MQRVLAELDVERHEEGALIIRDAYEVDRQLPGMPNATKGRGFKDVYLSNKEILRVRVFHPEKAEGITGADIVYEKHYRGENRARIAAVQYKLWDDKELRIDQRTKGQIERMKGFFCDQKACLRGKDIEYRFPHCAAFFRPTDKLQNADQELRTTGEHIPICEIDNLKFIGPKGGEYLRYEDIRHVSLNHDVFEDLFTNEKVGSRSLSYEELEGLYKKIAAYIGDIEHNTLIYHAQLFNLTDD